MDTSTEVEEMPAEVLEILMGLGLDKEQAEEVGKLGQKIQKFALDNIGDGDVVTTAELAMASIACKMTAAWFESTAVDMTDADK